MAGVFTIPADCCFVTTLADGLWQRVGGDPLALASYDIYLPTRRACRVLREAFLRVTGHRAALLPRMRPLGDVDDDDFVFADSAAIDDLLPAISPLRRQMLLTQMVMKKDKALPLGQASALAAALGMLLDQAQTAAIDLTQMASLVPAGDLAAHWQQTLSFLEIITHAWPEILAAEGCVDVAEWRMAVLDRQCALWRDTPPEHPVIVAGSTGSVPAVGRLMAAIAVLPKGEVILPALGVSLDEEAWQVADETHPQYTMKLWLESSGFKRKDVQMWQETVPSSSRIRLLQEIMRPASVSDQWQKLTQSDIPLEAVRGLEALALDHLRQEADVIALRLRGALEEEGKTAALVTPDRALAARVAAALTRWGITVNDSAGAALDTLPVGRFLIDVLKAAAPDAGAIDTLTLLKHPLAAAGYPPSQHRAFTCLAEEKLWRGPAREGGLFASASAMDHVECANWLAALCAFIQPLTGAWEKERPLEDWIDAHMGLAQVLAASDTQDGGDRLWRGDDGEAAALWLSEWRGAVLGFAPVDGAAYLALFEELVHQVAVRPAYGQHPRLSILGPLEARLLHHDLIILGGLNEGIWPPDAPIDPWMSRPMKRALGLPSPERRIGLSAHDFVMQATAPRVVLTRSKRSGGSPTVPSRFWVQLETVLQAVGLDLEALRPTQPWDAWAHALDLPDGLPRPEAPPMPCPPLDVRPKKLSVTEISTWLSNPYAIYAKHILKLEKLEPIDAEPSMADFGTIVHAALEFYVKEGKSGIRALIAQGRIAFAPFENRPQVMAFWWPRFEKMAAWFVAEEKKRRARGIKPLAAEVKGRLVLGDFTLSARVDRIDHDPDGRIEIIDYKTGGVPTIKTVMAGYEPQLALLALMARAGALEGIAAGDVSALSYWAIMNKDEEKRITRFEKDLEVQCAKAQDGLEKLIAAFADPAVPYAAAPNPRFLPRYNDYAHLARMAEWSSGQEGGEE